MRILWYSNAPWAPTGYGTQTQMMLRKLLADGHQVAVANNFGLTATTLEYEGVPIYPTGDDMYSNDIIAAHYADWARDTPTQLITLYDVWPLRAHALKDVPYNAAWVPVDHWPVPPESFIYLKTSGARPIAMSRFGEEQLRLAGFDPLYAPHMIDTTVMRPTEALTGGVKVRDWWGVPDDRFVVTINAKNKGKAPPRKAFGAMFDALGIFMAAHPDVFVYVHSEYTGSGSGIDLDLLRVACGVPEGRMRFADRYALEMGRISAPDLAAIYTASDVLLATSMGEGFGIPVVEAQACGTPVIVSDATAQPELVGAGWKADGWRYWDNLNSAWLFEPFVPSIVEKLEAAYAARGDSTVKRLAIEKAAEYDQDVVYPTYWRPILADLERRMSGPSPLILPNREQRRAALRVAK